MLYSPKRQTLALSVIADQVPVFVMWNQMGRRGASGVDERMLPQSHGKRLVVTTSRV